MATAQFTDPAQFPGIHNLDPCIGSAIDASLTHQLSCTDWTCACNSYANGGVFSSLLSSQCPTVAMFISSASEAFGQFCAQTAGPTPSTRTTGIPSNTAQSQTKSATGTGLPAGGLSKGGDIGIGVGVALVVLISVLVAGWWWLRYGPKAKRLKKPLVRVNRIDRVGDGIEIGRF